MKWIISFIFSILAIPAISQVDTTRIERPMERLTYYHLESPHRFQQIDTSLNDFFIYNPVYGNDEFHSYLGNIGQPHLPLFFLPKREAGFDLGYHQYDLYLTDPEEAKFNNPPFPFTYLRYVQGLQSEQLLQVKHSQNFGGVYNLGVDYRLFSSNGSYERQQTNVDDLVLHGRFRSPDKKWDVLAVYVLNDVDHENNGGMIVADTMAIDMLHDNLFYLQPFGLEATSAQTDFNRKYGLLRTGYNLGSFYERAINDSVSEQIFIPQLQLVHLFEWHQQNWEYRDLSPSEEYYDEFYLSLDSTFDQTAMNTYTNRFGAEWLGVTRQTADTIVYSTWQAKTYIAHEYSRINQHGRFYDQQHILAMGEASVDNLFSTEVGFSANGKFTLVGPEAGDHEVTIAGAYDGLDFIKLRAVVMQQLKEAPFIFEHYLSNHRFWENDFRKQGIQSLNVEATIPKWRLGVRAGAFNASQYLYFNSTAEPSQFDGSFRIIQLQAWHHLQIGAFHLINHFFLQQIPDNSPVHLPNFMGTHRLYYQGYFFRRSLFAQIGIDARYHTPYLMNRFDPVSGHFYLQDEVRVPMHIPEVDIFINGKVKSARIFAKLSNSLTLVPGLPETFYSAAYYPMRSMNFSFGVDWILFD